MAIETSEASTHSAASTTTNAICKPAHVSSSVHVPVISNNSDDPTNELPQDEEEKEDEAEARFESKPSLEIHDIFRMPSSHNHHHHHSSSNNHYYNSSSNNNTSSYSKRESQVKIQLENDDDYCTKSFPTVQSTKSNLTQKLKFNPIFVLFVGLIFSTTLAIVSAFDAARNCTYGTHVSLTYFDDINSKSKNKDNRLRRLIVRQLEDVDNGDENMNNIYYDYYKYNNYINNNDDDDGESEEDYQNKYEQAEKCKLLFMNVLIPVSFIVNTISIISCKWTLRDDTAFQIMEKKNINIPSCIELSGEDFNRDRKRYDEFKAYVLNQKQHLYSCYKLFVLTFICLTSWAYAMYMIADDSDQPMSDGEDKQEDRNLFKFQFESLGAFNLLGEVGQNANLYYSTWISLIVTLGLVYEVTRITHKQYVSSSNLESELDLISRHMVSHTKEIEMVMSWSKSQRHMVKVKRKTWQESLHKLRFRAGFWLVVSISSVIIYCSSSRIWKNYIYPIAQANGDVQDDGTICTIIDGFQARDDMGFFHPNKCERTLASKATGIVCLLLSLAALVAHYRFARNIAKELEASSIIRSRRENKSQIFEKRKKLIPLRLELLFAIALTIILAYNACMVTAVEGPGSKVGNLYYSSWICFVMSMLIMLGCVEDILDQEDEELLQKKESYDSQDRRNLSRSRWLSVRQMNDHISTRLIMLPSSHDNSDSGDDMTIGSYIMPIPTPNGFHQILEERFVQEQEASRPSRLRRWASSCIFSSIYLVSVLDAAIHISYGQLDYVQLAIIICPCIMVVFCFIMTMLCILDYKVVDKFFVGGLISIMLMVVWVVCLILTLHSESSWAVNEIGEIENANLYYFTWATVLNTGMLSSSYVKPFMKKYLNSKPKGLMVILWLAVVKICFVTFGSCIDIILSIGDKCKAAEKGDDTDVFCKRTEAGAIFGFIGMVTGFLAAVYRFYVPNPSINGVIGESIMSTILAIIFAFSLAMVTGIGGPGQAVGDLYYGSWLAFLAALGVAGGLYSEVLKKKKTESMLVSSDSSVGYIGDGFHNSSTPYSIFATGFNNGENRTMV